MTPSSSLVAENNHPHYPTPDRFPQTSDPKSPKHSSRAQPAETFPLAHQVPPRPSFVHSSSPNAANCSPTFLDAWCGDSASCVQFLRGCLLIQRQPNSSAKGVFSSLPTLYIPRPPLSSSGRRRSAVHGTTASILTPSISCVRPSWPHNSGPLCSTSSRLTSSRLPVILYITHPAVQKSGNFERLRIST